MPTATALLFIVACTLGCLGYTRFALMGVGFTLAVTIGLILAAPAPANDQESTALSGEIGSAPPSP